MRSGLTQASTDAIEDIFPCMIDRGVRLWIDNGQLNFKMPAGAATQEEIKALQASRDKIKALLAGIHALRSTEIATAYHSRVDFAPLAFSQLVHWKLHELRDRKSVRVVASAVRLLGDLDIEALRIGVEMMIHRHEALRTRIGIIGASPIQIIFESAKSEIRVDDLTVSPRPVHEGKLQRIILEHILEPIDVATDALFSARLVKLSSDEHVLILAMDHMISDGMSLAILLRDLFEEYDSAKTDRRSLLPKISVQFADYAAWQRGMYKLWAATHAQHWSDHLSDCRILAHPEEAVADGQTRYGLGSVPIPIDSDLRDELRQWCRVRRTTLVMGVFTAFVALVFRWYRASEGVIQYQTSGRSMVEVQNTVGYFAFRLYLRLCVCKGDSFLDLMDRIKAEYVMASEHAEFSSINAHGARPEIARSPCFNWLVHEPMRNDINGSDKSGGIRCSGVSFDESLTSLDDFKTDTDLMVGFRELGNEIHGAVQFPKSMISIDSAARFSRNLIVFVRALLSQCERQVAQIELVA